MKINMLKIIVIALVMSFTLPNAYAKQAGIVLLPTRIVLGPKDRNVTVMVKNNGDAVGAYRIELVDMNMPEKGALKELPESQKEPYSAKPLLRISPRQIVLKPGEDQNVRILVRKPRNLEDGEYRTHLKVKMVDDNVEGDDQKKADDNVVIQVRPRFALVIPVIVREGKTDAKISLIEPKIHQEKSSKVLDMVIVRNGNQSVIGDVDITYVTSDGKRLELQHHAGVAVYRPTEKRYVSIPLETPKGVALKGGKLHITYKAQEKDGGKVLAETYMPL